MENEEKNLSEEGLGDIIEEQGKALTETLKEQQNPQDPNTVEKELEERAKEKELKKKLTDEIEGNTRGSTSFSDPLRFQKQLTEFNEKFPQPTFEDVSETYVDFKMGAMGGSLINEYVPFLPRGVLPALTGATTATVGKFKKHIFDAIDSTGVTQPFKIIFRGDLLGDTTLGFPRKKAGLKKIPPTTTRDLGLYGATDDMFEDLQTTSLNTALAGGSVRGGRFVKLQNATTGQPEYYTVFTRGGKTQILPYNTWYQKNVNPFMVPKKLLENWRKNEAGQQLNLFNISTKNPFGAPMLDIPYGTKGKTRQVVAKTRYPKGTVDKFNDWYKEVFRLQKEEQKLNRQLSIMLERLGNIEARNPGKKVFDTDLSHIAPRSKGGSGLTFQEAWILNQGRGAKDILNPELLAAAGIPRNWDELFNYWLMQQKKGKEFQTAIGPLEHINVDDYFALSKGEPLSVVGRRRQNIRNLVERQQGDFETHTYASNINPGNDIGDDFTDLVRQSKQAQPGGATYMINQNLLDLRYVADNYEDLLDLGEI